MTKEEKDKLPSSADGFGDADGSASTNEEIKKAAEILHKSSVDQSKKSGLLIEDGDSDRKKEAIGKFLKPKPSIQAPADGA